MPSIPHMPWMSPDSQDMFAKNIADAKFKFILALKSFLHWIMAFVGPSVVSFTAKVGRSFPQHIMLFLPESCRDGENINFTLHKCVQICRNMCTYVKIYANVYKYLKICANMYKYFKICANISQSWIGGENIEHLHVVQIWANICNMNSICTNMYKYV